MSVTIRMQPPWLLAGAALVAIIAVSAAALSTGFQPSPAGNFPAAAAPKALCTPSNPVLFATGVSAESKVDCDTWDSKNAREAARADAAKWCALLGFTCTDNGCKAKGGT